MSGCVRRVSPSVSSTSEEGAGRGVLVSVIDSLPLTEAGKLIYLPVWLSEAGFIGTVCSVCLSGWLAGRLSETGCISTVCTIMSVCLSVCLSVCPSVCLSVCLYVRLSGCLRPAVPSVCLSVCLSAPEIFDCQRDERRGYSFPVDWWSLGVVALELRQGRRPFDIHASTPIGEVRDRLRAPPRCPTSSDPDFTALVGKVGQHSFLVECRQLDKEPTR